MGWILVGVGLLMAVVGYLSGAGVSPISAPQQTVQELRFLHGALGLVLAGLGIVALLLAEIRDRLRLANTSTTAAPNRAAEADVFPHSKPSPAPAGSSPTSPAKVAQGPVEYTAGARVIHTRFGPGTVLANDRGLLEIKFDDGQTTTAGADWVRPEGQ